MKKKVDLNVILAVIGAALFCIGGFGIKLEWLAGLRVLAVVFIGVGCVIFGHSFGTILQTKIMEKHPAETRKIEIEQKDERNIMIQNVAKSKAFDAMGYIYAALMLIFALLNFDYIVILFLVGSYLTVYGIMIYYLSRLRREM
jgi:hypothetical protein